MEERVLCYQHLERRAAGQGEGEGGGSVESGEETRDLLLVDDVVRVYN